MDLIGHVSLASNSGSITFSNIPDGYTDLLLLHSLRTTLGSQYHFDDMGFRINGDTGNNYTNRLLQTRDGSISSGGGVANFIVAPEASAGGAPGNTFGSGRIYFANYLASIPKSVYCEGASESSSLTQVITMINTGVYSGASPITSIQIYSRNSQSLVTGSSASLYGILSGSDGSTSAL
jgi:hypothetical protein